MYRVTLTAFLATLSGCALIFDTPVSKKELRGVAPKATTSEVRIEDFGATATPTPATPALDFIQVMWRVPDQPVDSYKIKYGPEGNKEQHMVTLSSGELKTITHPEFGQVYKALIPSDHSEERVFISITAIVDGIESNPSESQEVKVD